MANKLRVGLIFGGRSGEHEVSLMSAKSVREVLDEDYIVTEIGITQEGIWLTGDSALEAFEKKEYDHLKPVILLPEPQNSMLYQVIKTSTGENLVALTHFDVIFPVLHGTFGEDGTIQGLLELADVAYIGGGVLASSVGMDKALFKEVMRANQIPVVDSLLFTRRQVESMINDVISQIESELTYPIFIKPANLGSSVGISKCHCREDLPAALKEAARYDRRVLVETGVNAREIEVSVLGNENPQASVPGEIIPNDEFYTYNAKYLDDKSNLIIPAILDPKLTHEICDYAVRAFLLIDCAGMARVDFLLDRDTNQVYLHEINTIPGFTQISMYPKLWEASGLVYADLVRQLIELAIERKKDRDQTIRNYQI